MSDQHVYEYEVSQEDGGWLVHVPELGLTAQARHLRETLGKARSIISLHLAVDPAEVFVWRSKY